MMSVPGYGGDAETFWSIVAKRSRCKPLLAQRLLHANDEERPIHTGRLVHTRPTNLRASFHFLDQHGDGLFLWHRQLAGSKDNGVCEVHHLLRGSARCEEQCDDQRCGDSCAHGERLPTRGGATESL